MVLSSFVLKKYKRNILFWGFQYYCSKVKIIYKKSLAKKIWINHVFLNNIIAFLKFIIDN